MENEDIESGTAEIRLILDNYDDLFSDFDPRPYSQKALSQDFLAEAKRASLDKDGIIDLTFILPAKKRNPYDETVIRKRLQSHFKHHHYLVNQEKKVIRNFGLKMIIFGIACMLITTYVVFQNYKDNFFITMIGIILEPAGWFFFWEGLNQIVFETRKRNLEHEFNKKLSGCKINFVNS